MWGCGPGDQRILRAIVLADRAHILTDLAIQLAPQIILAHVITSTVNHAIAHPDLYQHARLTPPALLLWLAREFDLTGEAFLTPMTRFETSTLNDSHFTCMPTFLGEVSVHPLYQTKCPVTFEEQFSDPTPFPHMARTASHTGENLSERDALTVVGRPELSRPYTEERESVRVE